MGIGAEAVSTTVKADFNGTRYCSTPVWTSFADGEVITSPLTDGSAEIEIDWGKQDWQDDVQPSTCLYALKNPDGRYTPGNSSSPYYPNVRRRVRTHVATTIAGSGGGTVDLFDGFWDDVTAVPQSGTYWVTQVDATDILGRMGTDTPLRGFVVEEMLSDSPICLYALQEAEGATTFADVTSVNPPGQIGVSPSGAGVIDAGQDPAPLSSASQATLLSSTMVQVTNSSYPSATASPGSVIGFPFTPSFTTTGTWECVVQNPTSPPGGTGTAYILGQTSSSGSQYWKFTVQPSGTVRFSVGSGGVTGYAETTLNLCDGNVHHVVGQLNGTQISITVDGGTNTSVGAALSSAITITPGTWPIIGADPSWAEPWRGAIAYVAMYPTFLDIARINEHWLAVTDAFSGEPVNVNIARMVAYRPNLGIDLDASAYNVGAGDCYGLTLQDAIVGAADADGGMVFADGNGVITFRTRDRLVSPSVAVTLDASVSEVDVGTQFRDDIQYVVNDVTVTRPGGADQRVFNATSIDQDGEAAQSYQVNIDTDANALALANWILAFGTGSQVGSPALTVNLFTLTSAAQAVKVLSLRPLDVVELVNLPAQAPASSMQLMVQGGSYTISSEEFTVTLYVTPVP